MLVVRSENLNVCWTLQENVKFPTQICSPIELQNSFKMIDSENRFRYLLIFSAKHSQMTLNKFMLVTGLDDADVFWWLQKI